MLLNDGAMAGGPTVTVMQAKLHFNHSAEVSGESIGWRLDTDWSAGGCEPVLDMLSIQGLLLGGASCRALVATGAVPGEGSVKDEDRRTVVFLLNPADECVWQAMDDWLTRGRMDIRIGRGHYLGKRVGAGGDALLDARVFVGDALESDVLGGALQQLVMSGRLVEEVAAELELSGSVYCAIADTPMLRESMKPLDEALWREHVLHQSSHWVLEGVWS